jgi:hypothetical protein
VLRLVGRRRERQRLFVVQHDDRTSKKAPPRDSPRNPSALIHAAVAPGAHPDAEARRAEAIEPWGSRTADPRRRRAKVLSAMGAAEQIKGETLRLDSIDVELQVDELY